MKICFWCVLFLCGFFISHASKPLKYKTGVKVRLETAVNTNRADTVRAVISEDDRGEAGQHILIAKGSEVRLEVFRTKSRGLGKPGMLRISPFSVKATDGQVIMLGGRYNCRGKNRKNTAVGLGVGTGLTCLPGVGFCFLMLKGGKVVVPAGTEIDCFYVDCNYAILVDENNHE